MKKYIAFMVLVICGLSFTIFTAQTLAQSQSKPKKGGVLKITTRSVQAAFGIPLQLRGQSRIIAGLAMDRMIQRSPKLGQYEGVLAESFEMAPDKSSYTFHLRKGVKFHDGTPFNAQAAKWNWDKVLAVKKTRGIMTDVSSFDVLDDHTLRANLSGWNAIMLEDFRHEASYLMSPTVFEKKGEEWCNQHPVGAGPWIFDKYVQRQQYIFKRNPDYWNQPYPYMDGIEIHVSADPMTQMASFLKGEVDGLAEVDMQTATELIAKGYKPNPLIVGGTYCFYGNIEDKSGFYSDIRVRKALEYAMDKKKMGDTIGRGYWKPLYEILRGSSASGDPGTTPRMYNVQKAKELLAEAGYPNGFKTKMVVLEKFYGDHVVAVQHALEAVGIKMEIEVLPGPMFQEVRFKPVPPNELRWGRARGRPGNGIIFYADSDMASDSINYPAVTRPEGFDKSLQQVMKTEGWENQVPILMKMEKMMYDHVFLVPLWNVPDIEFRTPDMRWDPKVRKHPEYNAGDRQIRYEIVWLDR